MIEQEEPWGWELTLDLYECNDQIIRSEEKVKEFTIELCDNVIHMTRYGEPWIKRFGKDEAVTGFTLFQPIEESNISAHFIENINGVCLNIFSCKPFDVNKAKSFCIKFFKAKKCKHTFTERMLVKS